MRQTKYEHRFSNFVTFLEQQRSEGLKIQQNLADLKTLPL